MKVPIRAIKKLSWAESLIKNCRPGHCGVKKVFYKGGGFEQLDKGICPMCKGPLNENYKQPSKTAGQPKPQDIPLAPGIKSKNITIDETGGQGSAKVTVEFTNVDQGLKFYQEQAGSSQPTEEAPKEEAPKQPQPQAQPQQKPPVQGPIPGPGLTPASSLKFAYEDNGSGVTDERGNERLKDEDLEYDDDDEETFDVGSFQWTDKVLKEADEHFSRAHVVPDTDDLINYIYDVASDEGEGVTYKDAVYYYKSYQRQLGRKKKRSADEIHTTKFSYEDTERATHEILEGGKADGKPDSEFDEKQLAKGIKTEMGEHTNDRNVAKEIAKDHLVEMPDDYYDKLKAMEKGGSVYAFDDMSGSEELDEFCPKCKQPMRGASDDTFYCDNCLKHYNWEELEQHKSKERGGGFFDNLTGKGPNFFRLKGSDDNKIVSALRNRTWKELKNPTVWNVQARAYNRDTKEPIGDARWEKIDTKTNALFKGCKYSDDVKAAYEAFWNELDPHSTEIVKVKQVVPIK